MTTDRPRKQAEAAHPLRIRETLQRLDGGWQAFMHAATSFPAERMDEHLSEDGWTRKQMLAHITAWHDLTLERVMHLLETGKKSDLTEPEDLINARVARQAAGRTAGEVLKDMDVSFRKLRRLVARLTDEQLVLHDSWAAHVIAGNTYEHYAEHIPDLAPPERPGTARPRR